MHLLVRRFSSLVLAISLGIAGCGPSGPVRFDLEGEVTYQGKPVPAGLIVFNPDTTKGNEGPQGFAHIKQGKYDTRDQGRKVTVGPHEVRIEAFDGKPGQELPLGKIMVQHTTTATLSPTETKLDFDIPASRR